MNARSRPCAATVAGAAQLAGEPLEQRRLLAGPPLGRERAALGQQQPAGLEDLAHERRIEPAAARHRVDEHVEPALRAPVADAHAVAVARLDEPQLLEPLDALAHRREVHAELGRERALRRQPLAGGVAAGEDVGHEPAEDLLGERSARNLLHHRHNSVPVFGTICAGCAGTRAAPRPAAVLPSDPARTLPHMPLCFIEPQDAIRVIAESVGREARRQLLGELVRAWVDEIPEEELASHYAKAVDDLDEHDLSMLAAWHASLEVGTPIANKDFLVNAFRRLGENRREALKIAAGLRGEDAFNAGVAEEQALEAVLPWLSRDRCEELVAECLELYCWDRLGSDN